VTRFCKLFLRKVPKLGFRKFVARICEQICSVISRDCAELVLINDLSDLIPEHCQISTFVFTS